MKLRLILFIIILVFLTAAFYAVLISGGRSNPQSNTCNRIVSLAPNITEILFELGLGEKIVGTSEFCNYPPAAQQIPRVGALMNPNFEAIAALKPDIVIIVDEMADYKTRFDSLGIETLIVQHDTIDEILGSINIIGKRCGKADYAEKVVSELKSRIIQIQNASKKQTPPRVLVSLGHDYSQDPCSKPSNIIIAGNDGFYSQMVEYAGGQNVYSGKVPYPAISWESLITLNPQIIIDIGPVQTKPFDAEIIVRQWKNFSQIDAAKNNAVYVFTEDYTAIPGPRFILTLEKIARIINPNEPNSN